MERWGNMKHNYSVSSYKSNTVRRDGERHGGILGIQPRDSGLEGAKAKMRLTTEGRMQLPRSYTSLGGWCYIHLSCKQDQAH